jgi:hypothetical protein
MQATHDTVIISCSDGHKTTSTLHDLMRLWWECPICMRRVTHEQIYRVMQELGVNRNN